MPSGRTRPRAFPDSGGSRVLPWQPVGRDRQQVGAPARSHGLVSRRPCWTGRAGPTFSQPQQRALPRPGAPMQVKQIHGVGPKETTARRREEKSSAGPGLCSPPNNKLYLQPGTGLVAARAREPNKALDRVAKPAPAWLLHPLLCTLDTGAAGGWVAGTGAETVRVPFGLPSSPPSPPAALGPPLSFSLHLKRPSAGSPGLWGRKEEQHVR
jgi:hypothetical protein